MGRPFVHAAALLGVFVVAGGSVAACKPIAPSTERVNVSSQEAQAETSFSNAFAAMSDDGRFVAFTSRAANLVPGDTNGAGDIFVRDRAAGLTTRVNVSNGGAQANDESFVTDISGDGRVVAFTSLASNLVPGDVEDATDIFVHDRSSGTTERVSVARTGETGNASSHSPSLSADGRFVAFESFATNLIPDDTNGHWDVFVRDRQTGQTERVSEADGRQANGGSFTSSLSANGRFVAFESFATNLVPGDTNRRFDIFVHDRQTSAIARVSVTEGGAEADGASFDPSLSADGQVASFHSLATNLVADDTNEQPDVFVYDLGRGTPTRVSVGRGWRQGTFESTNGRISADGRAVTFTSLSALVPRDRNDDYDAFFHDVRKGVTELISVSTERGGGNLNSSGVDVSADGRYVAFESYASNLVVDDTNVGIDVFVRDRSPKR
jgi:Tol biopolymer transport system component